MRSFAVLSLVWVLLFSCTREKPRFERLESAKTGIRFNNEIVEQDTFNIMHNEYMYNGGGVGIADLNNDGLADVVLVGNKVSSRIFLNAGGLKFNDITANFEGLSNNQWLSGVAAVDINADGWTDLYFTSTMSDDSLQRKNRLWVNQGLDGDGLPHFKEMAEQYGIADMGHSMHAAFLDYDLDGDLDLYVLNNVVGEGVPTNYRPKVIDGSSVNNDQLYQNLGNGRFANVTREAGIIYEGFGLGVAVGDINKDGYPDIYVSNDYIANDLLYINQGDGTFRNESEDYLSYHSRFSMGNDMADINQDGYLDIMTLDMFPEKYFRKKQTINGNSYLIYNYNEKYGYERQYVRNMVHLNNGLSQEGKMLPFSEVGQMMGVYQTEWSWSALFADYDNDGDRDLLVTNGFPKDLTDKDFTNYKAQVYGSVATDADVLPRIPVVKVANFAFENTGDFRFVDHTKEWGMDIPSFSNGASFVDLDNDGDLDYVVNNINDEAFVYRNNTVETMPAEGFNYMRLHLTGSGENTLAIGAKVELWDDGKLQYTEHFLSRGYLSSVDPVIHFGLGGSDLIDSVRIVWPTGKRATLLKDVQPNQLLEVNEADAAPYDYRPRAAAGEPLFAAYDAGVAYRHSQQDFIDFFQTQRIIQHKLSQIGPCMAKGDIDGDGNEDLLIGASDQLPTTVFLHKGDRFENAQFPGLTDNRQCTESDLIIMDMDGDGDNDVVALSGGYMNDNENDYQHFVYRNDGGAFTKVQLPLPPFPASVVRPFDFDHDGDADLFVGARVKKGAYPYAEKSYLVINDNGEFSTSPAASFDLGMVTDAVWSDYDGDGWEDLLITREWNTLAVLQSQQGKELKPAAISELDGKRGFWLGIAAGDLDADGDDDYIVGNLGENHRFNISDELPMRLYAVDIDNNGVIDPFTTAYWQDKEGKMQEYPVNYLDELAAQSPFFRKKFTSYTQFSFTTVDSILDKANVPAERIFQVNTTSSYILWNEGGKFGWERLPDGMQVAPLREILLQDFNGDNLMDILAAGNDYTYDVSTGYYDANKGMLLLGKGNRAFEVLPPAKSGLLLHGQVESLLFFGGETPLLVAGINRDSVLVYRQQPRPAN